MAESNVKASERLEVLGQYCLGLVRSTALLHWIGYGFLLLALIDFVELIVPPNFMNPAWEFQTFGAIVERVAVLLIGFGLVFFGEKNGRAKGEFPLLRGLSWLVLILAIAFFLMIPLGVVNTIRLDRQYKQQVTAQVQRGKNQIQQIQQQLAGISTPEEMTSFLNRLDRAGRSPAIANSQQLQEVKEQLVTSLAQGETAFNTQARELQANQRVNLLKKSVKWNLGALIAGMLLLCVWQGTRWAR